MSSDPKFRGRSPEGVFQQAANALHHLFLAEWQAAYPEARLYAPPRLQRKRRDLAFEATLADAPEPEWVADIDQVVVRGSFYLTEVVFFHRHSRTVLFADLIQNFRATQ